MTRRLTPARRTPHSDQASSRPSILATLATSTSGSHGRARNASNPAAIARRGSNVRTGCLETYAEQLPSVVHVIDDEDVFAIQ